MQLVFIVHGRPLSRCSGLNNGSSLFNICFRGGHGLQNRTDLAGVDAPHAGVAKLSASPLGGQPHGLNVGKFGHHAMRGHLAVRVTRSSNFQFGSNHQGMTELPPKLPQLFG